MKFSTALPCLAVVCGVLFFNACESFMGTHNFSAGSGAALTAFAEKAGSYRDALVAANGDLGALLVAQDKVAAFKKYSASVGKLKTLDEWFSGQATALASRKADLEKKYSVSLAATQDAEIRAEAERVKNGLLEKFAALPGMVSDTAPGLSGAVGKLSDLQKKFSISLNDDSLKGASGFAADVDKAVAGGVVKLNGIIEKAAQVSEALKGAAGGR